MKMQDLTRINNVTKSTATHYVDYLEKKGFVRRVRDEGDRREIYIELTDMGRAWVEANHEKMEDYVESRVHMFTKEDWITLVSLMSRLVGDIDATPYDQLIENAMKIDK